MTAPAALVHLRGGETSLLLSADGGIPVVEHFGADLGLGAVVPPDRAVLNAELDVTVPQRLLPLAAEGWMGRPGVSVWRLSDRLAVGAFTLESWDSTDTEVRFAARDAALGVVVSGEIVARDSAVFEVRTRLTNSGTGDVVVDSLRPSLTVGAHAVEMVTLGGRHEMEAVVQRSPWGRSLLAVENRGGRTSHERLGVVFVGAQGFSDETGEVWGFHIAWSGNFELTCDGVTEGLRTVQVAELLGPGEMVLAPGQVYEAPVVLCAHSMRGSNGVSRAFHRWLRARTGHTTTPRPVICNTWEAVWFDHDLDTLMSLAERAARVGAERFVLDDGWFGSRRDDRSGLGDWWVSDQAWPTGLDPLIDRVKSLGMDFGIWFEPEMVNPDSDLYRAHPDWALGAADHEPGLLGRHQLVLDLSRAEVRDYLFDRIDAVLSAHDIAYVKWDHNRPVLGGRSHAQTRGAYELFTRLRAAHPGVQWESCASGGGRIDMGIAEHVVRYWGSDSIDALDRIAMQRGLSMFMPPEMIGSHIGAPVCHSTGRRHPLAFRASTAMFGWLGVEWNLLRAEEDDLDQLSRVIATYKRHRALLHGGDVLRIDHADANISAHAVVAPDRAEALVWVSRTASGPSSHIAPVRVAELEPDHIYEVSVVDLGPMRLGPHRVLPGWMPGPTRMSGRELGARGLIPPPLLPASTLVLHLVRTVAR